MFGGGGGVLPGIQGLDQDKLAPHTILPGVVYVYTPNNDSLHHVYHINMHDQTTYSLIDVLGLVCILDKEVQQLLDTLWRHSSTGT